MKKIKIIFAIILLTNFAIGQTIDINGGTGYSYFDAPSGTYLKDVNNSFGPILGIWKYQNGNEILIFKIEKITHHFYPDYSTYADFLIGNYSYSLDGGVSYVVNSISQNLGNTNPFISPMYSSGFISSNEIEFTFKDLIIQKSSCRANFKFLIGSTNQVELKLWNRGGGYLHPETAPNPNFSIPRNVILTKQ